MSEVIRWTVSGGLLIFCLGLISAIGSRRQHKTRSEASGDRLVKEKPIYVVVTDIKVKKDAEPMSAMSMAASGGQLNGEESLASVGNRSR